MCQSEKEIAAIKNQLRKNTEEETPDEKLTGKVKTGIMAGIMTLGTGYIVFVNQGIALLSSFLTSVPLWKSFDPLPIFDASAIKKSQEKEWQDEIENEEQEKKINSYFDKDDNR